LKKNYIFLSKIAIYLSLGLHKGRPSYEEAFSPHTVEEHPALQKMKFIYFFQFFWVILVLLDPDPRAPLNPDPQH
jgi:hypothetical protein